MAKNSVGGATDTGTETTPPVVDRITVALVPKAVTSLQALHERTGLSKTDLVNRAVILYDFIEESLRGGRDVLVRDKKSGEQHTVVLL